MNHRGRWQLTPLALLLALAFTQACDQKQAAVLRVVEYQPSENDSITVTTEDSAGTILHTYTQKSRLRSEYGYNPYNPRQVDSVLSERYLATDDGKEPLGKMLTKFDVYENPERMYLISPEDMVVGQFSFAAERKHGRMGWTPEVFYSDLPSAVFAYNGKELIQIDDLPREEKGMRLGHKDRINVIFATDFQSIRAVLPRAVVTEGGNEYEIGFTFVEGLEGCGLCPYRTGFPGGVQRTTIWNVVPDSLEKDFQQLVTK